MTTKKADTSYEALLEEALANAQEDRNRAVEAFEQTKQIYDVKFDGEDKIETLQGLMLVGQNVHKLLEVANKSNEQIIKLAQLREKENSRKKEDTKGALFSPGEFEEIRNHLKEEDKKLKQ